ncbi:MAG: MFS transporter [Actinomycetota bacterium]
MRDPDRPSRLRRVAIDLTPLRVSRDFRLLYFAGFVSALGVQVARTAIFIQVFDLTGSTAAVGMIGLTGFVALVLGTLIGSGFIDVHDRRLTLIWTQVTLIVASVLLVLSASAGGAAVWLVFVANAIMAFTSAIESPARQAMIPRLVGTRLVPSAVTLTPVGGQPVSIGGPAPGGLAIAAAGGYALPYWFNLITYLVLLLAAFAMRPMPPERTETAARGRRAVAEGFGYVRRNRLIQSTFVIDLIAMIYGMPQALFPVIAISQFHRGPAVAGLLFAAPSVGALLQAVASGWAKHVVRQGVAVLWSVAGWGAAIAAFGLAGSELWLALVLLAVAGAADVISAIFRSTIMQVTTPDHLRGRIGALFTLVVTGGPRLGDFEAGVVAQAFSPTVSVVTGGLACIVGAGVVAGVYPELRRYRARVAA